jgi:hypothetical protein
MSEQEPPKEPMLPRLEDDLLKAIQALDNGDVLQGRNLLNDALQRHYGIRIESVRNEDGSISDHAVGDS